MKMQNIHFNTIDDLFEFLPESELKLLRHLRNLVFNCIPDVSEKLMYNIPCYRKHKDICFIWPASVLWGKKKTYEGVRLGFSKGYMLPDDIGYLDKGNRKQVYWRDIQCITENDTEILNYFITEAALIDEQTARIRRQAKDLKNGI